MPERGTPLRKLGFLTIGRFDPADPLPGLAETLEVIERAEALGFDSVWLRCRHLQPGISSPLTVLAAASQRTRRIELGTAVIPLGWENPLRLAEDLATVDLLSGGRLNPGLSVGTPMRYDHVRSSLYPHSADIEDFSKQRLVRLLEAVRGEPVSDGAATVGIETYTAGVQPHSPGLAERIWYGGGRESARWAASRGLNYLTSSVVSAADADAGEPAGDFAAIQAGNIDAYRAAHPEPARARVSQGLVVIPTDSATDDQKRRYRDYAAARQERTRSPQGPRATMFSPDYVGDSDELADRLFDHAGFRRADEAAFALPFDFTEADYRQIIGDLAEHLGPRLGWSAASAS